MTRKCILCGQTTATVSYHAFPKDVVLREKWKEFCQSANIGEANFVCHTNYLCSSHFLAEDYLHPVGSVRNKLKKHAVPSVHHPILGRRNYAQIVDADEDNCVSKHPKFDDTGESENVDEECSSIRSVAIRNMPLDEINDVEGGNEIPAMTPPSHKYSTAESDEIPSMTPPSHRYSAAESDVRSNVSACGNLEDDTITGTGISCKADGQNSFFQEPRYVGDIKSPHLATPRRAKRAVTLAKITIARQKSKILSLQQTTRRL
ncbi:uncharacterized protein LOC124414662 isoform X1 [Diprion similis]|uniref:uncharacterized protein LOC124414662 isoform X1 n=1 Tax=Diprion similis TaxID=362088 RepID=UPI001EF7EA5F|nr:uncharacterized protein LOC124414662 isoform X1 [Diprion similis]